MEQQLRALGSGFGASVAEALALADGPMRWKELHQAVGTDRGSRGTLTKTLTRMSEAGLVEKQRDRYRLVHAGHTGAVLRAAAELHQAIAATQARTATERASRLRDAFSG